MWNARMQWGFNHDPCHETIYHQEMGEGFLRVNLPQSIRQIGLNEGQSWSNPTKFVTDALTLEEKMISENDMLELHRRYHFWYIGKSYFDAHECNTFPLGDSHRREYARRAIWYFAEWIKHVFKDRPPGVDESAYNGLIFSAEARRFLGEWEEYIVEDGKEQLFGRLIISLSTEGCSFNKKFLLYNRSGSYLTSGYYDPAEKAWIETFMFRNGNYTKYKWVVEGKDVVMVRIASSSKSDYLNRNRWTNITPDSFDILEERSYDLGKTWKVFSTTKLKRK
jgi:hypothetical protein